MLIEFVSFNIIKLAPRSFKYILIVAYCSPSFVFQKPQAVFELVKLTIIAPISVQ
jgi:hypothetical protein